MARDVQVIADGVESESTEDRPVSPFFKFGAAAAVVVGFLVVLFVPLLDNDQAGPATNEPVELDRPGAAIGATGSGIAELLPGFADALVVVSGGEDPEHLLWPVAGPLLARPMSTGGSARFDANSQYLAVGETGGAHDTISVGRHSHLVPALAGVTSLSWHATAGGHLGYTRESDGVWGLYRLQPNLTSDLVASDLTDHGAVIGWGDWGWAIQTADGEILLLTAAGELKDVHPGIGHAVTGDGWLFVVGDTAQLVSAGGGVRGLDIPPRMFADLESAAFSHDGDLLALSARDRTVVVNVSDGGSVVAEFAGSSVGPLVWTSDDRYVFGPAESGVVLFDLGTGIKSVVLEQYSVETVGALPLGNT